jgi:hypothetical protein
MGGPIIAIDGGFWNIRGSFRVGGVVDVGTQASLVRLASGKFVFLDSYSFNSSTRRAIAELTRGGEDIEAILNLHPFHTVHVRRMHELYPRASLHGTVRHLSRFPELPWSRVCTEDPALHQQYAEDFEFSVPGGVDFVSANENVHFSSVLALHRASRTIHSDDTLTYVRLPGLMRLAGLGDKVIFHPTLDKALEKRPGAAAEFHAWARDLIERWRDAENLCAAHTAPLLARDNRGGSIHDRLQEALRKVSGTLRRHERRYG